MRNYKRLEARIVGILCAEIINNGSGLLELYKIK